VTTFSLLHLFLVVMVGGTVYGTMSLYLNQRWIIQGVVFLEVMGLLLHTPISGLQI
jgi:hypothetical protein